MDRPKKILVLYASAGHGHEKAAKAVAEACRALSGAPDAVKIIDTIQWAPAFYGNFYRRSYLTLIQHTPWLWGLLYYGLDQGWIYGWMRWVRRVVNSITARKLKQLIIHENPDVIVTAHFMSTEVASHLKQSGQTNAKIINVITDYLPHHIWLGKCVDIYAVALQETKAHLIRWGVTAEKIRVVGIPVEKKFLSRLPALEARKKLSLDPKAFTVLITSGGAGIGSMKNIVKRLLGLKKSIQILVVCGTNQELRDVLSASAKENALLKPLGFVNNMDECMAASDIVIGKGGGLTVAESLSQGKPMILFQSIPGQEARNAACIQKYKAGLVANSPEEVVRQVIKLLESPAAMEAVKKSANEMYIPDSAARIARLALE
ncbi:MAG: hypothetical protein AUJ71_02830 [Candidatus Omnitrophica bacterium CG1_02_49_16]|nr:MAG: hypothetical protein AUJ71_02830 [Candidatus Omnitrophica bacterium CG1_02_49_16]